MDLELKISLLLHINIKEIKEGINNIQQEQENI